MADLKGGTTIAGFPVTHVGNIIESMAMAGINIDDKINVHAEDYIKHTGYAVATGDVNAYVVTLNPPLSDYAEGVTVRLKINVENTLASTVNIDGKGEKEILNSDGSSLASGSLIVGSVYTLVYNGLSFILQGKGGGIVVPTGFKKAKGAAKTSYVTNQYRLIINGLDFKPSFVVAWLTPHHTNGFHSEFIIASSTNELHSRTPLNFSTAIMRFDTRILMYETTQSDSANFYVDGFRLNNLSTGSYDYKWIAFE